MTFVLLSTLWHHAGNRSTLVTMYPGTSRHLRVYQHHPLPRLLRLVPPPVSCINSHPNTTTANLNAFLDGQTLGSLLPFSFVTRNYHAIMISRPSAQCRIRWYLPRYAPHAHFPIYSTVTSPSRAGTRAHQPHSDLLNYRTGKVRST